MQDNECGYVCVRELLSCACPDIQQQLSCGMLIVLSKLTVVGVRPASLQHAGNVDL